jgi:hypothetical protein
VLVAAEAAFRELGDEALEAGLWPVVRRAADLLVSFVDPATGLPRASIDLWEQHDAQHAYSAAAVVGGLRAPRHSPPRDTSRRSATCTPAPRRRSPPRSTGTSGTTPSGGIGAR